MPEPAEAALVKSVESLLADREAMAARETKLIEDLNAALRKMGYRVVAMAANAGTDSGRKRGRPKGSGKRESPKPPATS